LNQSSTEKRRELPIGHSILVAFGLALILLLSAVVPGDASPDWSPLVTRLIANGLDEPRIRELFSRPELQFEPAAMSAKLEELLKRPARAKGAGGLSSNPMTMDRAYLRPGPMTLARSFLRENAGLLERISAQYGVPKEVIVSILLIETNLGKYVGRRGAFSSLASMALCSELETILPYLPKKLVHQKNEVYARSICREKSAWAYGELEFLLLYADQNGIDPLSLPGSVYGAFGLCQFMPSSCLLYAIDGDEDGRIDLFTRSDALFSIANYLREHGWYGKLNKVDQLRVVLDYNKSWTYANTVVAVAERLKVNNSPKTIEAVAAKIPDFRARIRPAVQSRRRTVRAARPHSPLR
jgi:membrane-bound lytic murein transglycosylase B